ncbi:MAG: galactokinase [Verrucomicrobiales bacterium]|jgi:galactokinase
MIYLIVGDLDLPAQTSADKPPTPNEAHAPLYTVSIVPLIAFAKPGYSRFSLCKSLFQHLVCSEDHYQSMPDTNFHEIFSRPPEHSARAPGRINFIGEHVDYQNGLVMPAAIDRYVYAEAAANQLQELHIYSSMQNGAPLVFSIDSLVPIDGQNSWANYVIGVVEKYRNTELRVPGFDIAFHADLPLGAGLSSSAALESATALIIESLTGTQKTAVERALLCQAAEHDFAGVPCGIMDQLAVNAGIAGHALTIDCRTLDVSPSPMPEDMAIIVVDSKVKHALADGEYAKRKADCETAAAALEIDTLRDATLAQIELMKPDLGDRVYRRARHVVTEIERVRSFSDALQAGDTVAIGLQMAASHASLRDDFEVSCPELDALVKIARDAGTIGSRMMGGGFGGSTVNLAHIDSATAIAETITANYLSEFGTEVEAFVVHVVDGAIILSIS